MAKIIYNRHIPFGSYLAVNLFGFIFVKHGKRLSRRSLNHELIHSCQQAEMLWVFFYLWYGFEWLVRLLQYHSFRLAYYNIAFEREAYANEQDLLYRRRRRIWAWRRYIIKT